MAAEEMGFSVAPGDYSEVLGIPGNIDLAKMAVQRGWTCEMRLILSDGKTA